MIPFTSSTTYADYADSNKATNHSLYNETAGVLSVIIGLDSVSRGAFVSRLTGAQLDRHRTTVLHVQSAGMDRGGADGRIESVNVCAPHGTFPSTSWTLEFQRLADFEGDHRRGRIPQDRCLVIGFSQRERLPNSGV